MVARRLTVGELLFWVVVSLPLVLLVLYLFFWLVFPSVGGDIFIDWFFKLLIVLGVVGLGRMILVYFVFGNIKQYDVQNMHKVWSDGAIELYKEGVRFERYFFEWKQVQSIYVHPVSGRFVHSLASNLASISGKMIGSGNARSHIVRIRYYTNKHTTKKLLALTNDREEFLRALSSLKKNKLIIK